jgi:hypothetical protein
MKQLLFILVALTFLAQSGTAQDSESGEMRKKFNVGLKIGANYSNVYDSQGESFDADGKLGFAGGLFIAIPIGRFIGIQPEILFSQKGFKGTGMILGSPYSLTRTTSYVDIPLLFAIKPASFFTLLLGPQYAYLLKQKDVFANGITTIAQETEFANDNIRKNTLAFIGGFDINVKHIVVGLRLGWDFQGNNGDGTSTTPRYKNAWTQATLGYRF